MCLLFLNSANSAYINLLKQSVKLSRLVVSISLAISFLGNQFFQNENEKPVLFSAMVFTAVFWFSTVLKTPAIFSLATRSRSKLRAIQIAWKRLIGPLLLPLFINQSEYRVFFFALNFVISALNFVISASNFLKTAFLLAN